MFFFLQISFYRFNAKDLEGLQIDGIEVIKNLDEYYEKHKESIQDKVIKSNKYKDFIEVRSDGKSKDDFTKFKMEITKQILRDLQKYCIVSMN